MGSLICIGSGVIRWMMHSKTLDATKMKFTARLFGAVLSALVIISSGLVSITHAQQPDVVPDGWTKISVCRLSFFGPPDLKDLGIRGVDSCVVQVANNDIELYLDYGRYGSPLRRNNSYLEYKEQPLLIDGKSGQLATFVDPGRGNSGAKYYASIYVAVKEMERDGLPNTISLMMSVRGESQKSQEIARRIFRTIHFD